uniref:G-protein coupled receptors family 1 profile domain-containing protein n=1 Tax=Anopheles quadriannulatus TaxID=34691 RepID=A0A182X2U8_ANOQN
MTSELVRKCRVEFYDGKASAAEEIHVPRPGDRYMRLPRKGSWAAFHISFFLSSYVVPLIMISVLYMWMLSRLWRSSVGGRSAESKKGKKRVTRLVVIVVAAFASLWFPIQSAFCVAGGTGVDRHSSGQCHLFTNLTTTTITIITLLQDTFPTLAGIPTLDHGLTASQS